MGVETGNNLQTDLDTHEPLLLTVFTKNREFCRGQFPNSIQMDRMSYKKTDNLGTGVPYVDADDDQPALVIKPKRGWLGVDFGELLHYRELLYFLVWRDLKARYKQTVIGAGWAILQPVVAMIVFSAIFGRLTGIETAGIPYPVWVYASLLPWMLFSNSVSQSSISLVSQTSLFTKIYFPRLLIPSSSVGVAVLDFFTAFSVYFAILGFYVFYHGLYGLLPGVTIILLPVMILFVVMAALGVGFILSSLTLKYRDFRSVIPFLMQTWMFASPVVWPTYRMGITSKHLMAANPMFGLIMGFQSVLLGRPIEWTILGISAAVSVVLFIFGLHYFSRMERRFADIA